MNKLLLLILLPALLSATGCKQQKVSETEGTTSKIEAHQPLPPKYTARYDKSVTPVRIDIERATADSVPVNLSKVASSIEYFMVGDDKYPITDVVATNEGFIALNQPKLYIIRKTKCFDFWERNVLFPKTKRSFFRTPTPLPCPFPLNFSLLIITKKFGNLAKNRYICIV